VTRILIIFLGTKW